MGHQGSPEERHLHFPGPLQDQDPPQAGDQSVQERDLRQDADGEGKTCSDDCESFPRGGFEEERLGLRSCSAYINSPWRCRWIDSEAHGVAPTIVSCTYCGVL